MKIAFIATGSRAGSGAGDDPRRAGKKGRQIVTEANDLAILVRITLGLTGSARFGGTRKRSYRRAFRGWRRQCGSR